MDIKLHGRYMIQITRFPLLFPISAYLVRDEDGLTLIDTGMSGSAKGFLATAAETDSPIVRIALTHSHVDHAGSLSELATLLPNAEILVGEREAPLLAGDRNLRPDEPQTKLRGSYITSETRPTRLLYPGDRVGALEVVAAPGHTPGQLAFFDRRDGSLIAGDPFQTRGGLAVSGKTRLRFPFPAMATWNRAAALETARSLHRLAPERLAVGHGPVVEAPMPAIERAIAEAERSFGKDVAYAS